MKQCQDCKHYRLGALIADPTGKLGECAAPGAQWIFASINRVDWFPLDILWGTCGRRARWFEPKPAAAAAQLPTITGLAARLNPQVPPKRMPVPQSRAVAAASVPRRAPAASASRSSTTDEGMSMLPSTVWVGMGSVGAGDDRTVFCCRVVGGGGSFDGGGASGNWDSGSSSSSDSGSSSDSSSSSSSD